jgi:hypothetical protein
LVGRIGRSLNRFRRSRSEKARNCGDILRLERLVLKIESPKRRQIAFGCAAGIMSSVTKAEQVWKADWTTAVDRQA